MYGQLMAGGKQFVHCREVVLLLECPLSEVLLYWQNMMIVYAGYTEHPLDRECVSFPSSTSLPTHSVAQDLTIILYPVGRDKKYSLYVSWQMNEDDGMLRSSFALNLGLMCVCVCVCVCAGNIEGFFIWNYRCIGPCPFQNDTNSLTSTSLPFYDREKYECLPIHNAVS